MILFTVKNRRFVSQEAQIVQRVVDCRLLPATRIQEMEKEMEMIMGPGGEIRAAAAVRFPLKLRLS